MQNGILIAKRYYNKLHGYMVDHIATYEVQRLTIETARTLEIEICRICQAGFRVREYLFGFSCGHGYHRDCLSQWVSEVRSTE